MLRHEQQSIRIALATVMHHSYKVHTENGAPLSQTTVIRAREGEVHVQHDGVRAQKRPIPGTRPGLPPESGASCGGCRAAGASSHGRLRGCREAAAGGPSSQWR